MPAISQVPSVNRYVCATGKAADKLGLELSRGQCTRIGKEMHRRGTPLDEDLIGRILGMLIDTTPREAVRAIQRDAYRDANHYAAARRLGLVTA